MSNLGARLGAGALALLMILGASACAVSDKPSGTGTVAPTNNPTAANARPTVDKTALPQDWPAEAVKPEKMKIVDVKATAGGATVLGTLEGSDPIKAGNDLKSVWEKNGALITHSSDENKTFQMSALSKDGKTQLTATIAKGNSGPLQIILTEAPAE